MAIEQIHCKKCRIKYTIEWDEDDVVDFLEPDFCPMCGESVLSDYDEDEYIDEDEE